MKLKVEMLQFLRERLSNKDSIEISRDLEVLTITMVICPYEIINTCDEQWVVYLRGARDIIRIRKHLLLMPSEQTLWEPLFVFAERFFAYQDVLGRTACAGIPNFKSCTWSSKVHEIDISMGCSPELFQILGSIIDLIRSRRKGSDESFPIEAARLGYQLENLVQTVHRDDDCIILHSAELKRRTAILYLHCTLNNASPIIYLVSKQVREILNSISLCLANGLVTSLTWSIFVAAVELNPLDDMIMVGDESLSGRAFILNTLEEMSACTIANIERTRLDIIDVGQRGDLSQLNNRSIEIAQDHRSDWEIYVESASTNLSLG